MEELNNYLSSLKKAGFIEEPTHRGAIRPGSSLHDELARLEGEADVVILLISQALLNEREDSQTESLLKRQSADAVIFIPVLLSDCLWKFTPLKKAQLLPRSGTPVAKGGGTEQAWTEICNELHILLTRKERQRVRSYIRERALLGECYQLNAALGLGQVETWSAVMQGAASPVAIKLLSGGRGEAKEAVRHFQAAAALLEAVGPDEGLARILVGPAESDGVQFFVRELIDGVNLLTRAQEGRIELNETVHLIRQVSDTLSRLHLRGVAHGNVHPANIIIQPDGRVRLTDPGLQGSRIDIFSAPELSMGERASASSDQYSLAMVTLSVMRGGDLPFRRVLRDPNRVVADGKFPDTLKSAVRRGIQDEPSHRFSSVAEFRDAVVSAADEVEYMLSALQHPVYEDLGLRSYMRGVGEKVAPFGVKREPGFCYFWKDDYLLMCPIGDDGFPNEMEARRVGSLDELWGQMEAEQAIAEGVEMVQSDDDPAYDSVKEHLRKPLSAAGYRYFLNADGDLARLRPDPLRNSSVFKPEVVEPLLIGGFDPGALYFPRSDHRGSYLWKFNPRDMPRLRRPERISGLSTELVDGYEYFVSYEEKQLLRRRPLPYFIAPPG